MFILLSFNPLSQLTYVKVLFIDEVHMLDIECFSFLNRALENELAPLVIMASNRGMSRIRGTTFKSPHGLPVDLLDRVLIVSTKPYSDEDIRQIIQIRFVFSFRLFFYKRLITVDRRCQEEDVTLTADALNVLASMASHTTLRYCLNLISCGHVVAKKRKAEQVDVEDLRKVYAYFMDEKRSVQWLKEQQGSLVFEEIKSVDEDAVPMDSS